MKDGKHKKSQRATTSVVLLKDLAPRKDVKGGAETILFGERLESPVSTPQAGKSKRALRKR
jgi:hypothetical protein